MVVEAIGYFGIVLVTGEFEDFDYDELQHNISCRQLLRHYDTQRDDGYQSLMLPPQLLSSDKILFDLNFVIFSNLRSIFNMSREFFLPTAWDMD